MDIKANIAKNIAELRQKSGLTQLEFAEKLNYSDKAVSKWERGESLPDITVLAAIAALFEVTLDYLIAAEHPIAEAPAIEPTETAEEVAVRRHSIFQNRTIVTCLGILSVWFCALAFFIIAEMAAPNPWHLFAFVYALPVSIVVWLVFNAVWFNPRRNYLIVSLLMWATLFALCMSFRSLAADIWKLFSLGIFGQPVIILCSRLKIVQNGSRATSRLGEKQD